MNSLNFFQSHVCRLVVPKKMIAKRKKVPESQTLDLSLA